MTQRERILAGIVVLLAVLAGGYVGAGSYREALEVRRSDLYAARERLGDAQLRLAQGQRAVQDLEAWQQRSLPANRDLAQSVYRTWLQERLKQAGLEVENIQPTRMVPTEAYTAIGFTISGRGTLTTVAKALQEFYRSPLLQQVTQLQLTPDRADPNQLNVSLQVEALLLPGSENEGMPEGESDRLAGIRAEELVQSIAARNLFAAYRPPRPDPPPPAERRAPPAPPPFDDAKFAFVTSTMEVDGRWQAWITIRTTGEVLRVFAGDPIKVGQLEGRIVSIEPRGIVIECGEEKLQVRLGDNLRDGKALAATQEG